MNIKIIAKSPSMIPISTLNKCVWKHMSIIVRIAPIIIHIIISLSN